MKVPYERLMTEAMLLWEKHHGDYQSLREDYRELLLQKRALGIRPLHKLKESELREWIEVPFLALHSRAEAEQYLSVLSEREIKNVISVIAVLRDSYIWNTLKARVIDFEYEIIKFMHPKATFAVDPDGISSRYYSNSTTNYGGPNK